MFLLLQALHGQRSDSMKLIIINCITANKLALYLTKLRRKLTISLGT